MIYALQFLIVANLRFHGAVLFALFAIYALDVYVAWSDVWEETGSRQPQGGLPRGEYFMHIVLSLLIGAYLLSVVQAVWPDRLLPTDIVVDPPPVPAVLRGLMSFMGVAAAGFFVHDMLRWLRFRRRRRAAVAHA